LLESLLVPLRGIVCLFKSGDIASLCFAKYLTVKEHACRLGLTFGISLEAMEMEEYTDKDDEQWIQVHMNKRILHVYGPPGSGKSLATFQCIYSVCNIAVDVQCTWMNCKDEINDYYWKIGAQGNVIIDRYRIPTKADDVTFFHIAIFDGLQQTTDGSWRWLINDFGRKGISSHLRDYVLMLETLKIFLSLNIFPILDTK
jgi:hypothetical protein